MKNQLVLLVVLTALAFCLAMAGRPWRRLSCGARCQEAGPETIAGGLNGGVVGA